MRPPSRFPSLGARDLQRRAVILPAGFEGERNVVLVAFRQRQHHEVDSWVPWLEAAAEDDPGLRFYEVPTIGTQWSPGRAMIDGGMASAIGDPVVLRRTLTAYTDVRRVTTALGIDSTETISVLLVDGDGMVRWQTSGRFTPDAGDTLAAALDEVRAAPRVASSPDGPVPPVAQFDFAFESRFRPLLALAGVVPSRAHVTVTDTELVAVFGPWACRTPLSNIAAACVTGPYRAVKAIGARGSLADGGATFGSTTAGGVCVRFRSPVPALAPFGLLRHPGLTVTVADREGLVATLVAAGVPATSTS